jgi:hypothetical protein
VCRHHREGSDALWWWLVTNMTQRRLAHIWTTVIQLCAPLPWELSNELVTWAPTT